jgi:hypothetical protein
MEARPELKSEAKAGTKAESKTGWRWMVTD